MSSSSLSSYPDPSDTMQALGGVDSDVLKAGSSSSLCGVNNASSLPCPDYYDGPFASKPDHDAVKYLKDHGGSLFMPSHVHLF